MIDFGLLLSAIIAIGVPALLAPRWGVVANGDSPSFIDRALGPLLLGLLVARLSAMALDEPGSLGRITDMIIIRSGVEFWPGVLAAGALVFYSARRAGAPAPAQLAAMVPLAIVGAAGYEATCVVRDGCYGPTSPIGLRPPGVATTMVPVGWLMALALVGAALALRRWAQTRDALRIIVAGVLVVAAVRGIGSFWLPHIGDGLSRPHWTSIVVAVLAGLVLLVLERTQDPNPAS